MPKGTSSIDDVNAADVRRILDKRFENGNFFVDGGWTWCLLEKHYDIENLPLIVKALQRANDQVERQNLRCTLRNVIYFGSRRKRKFFPYDFDAFQKLTDADLSKISEIWEKRKAEIIEASKHEVEHSWDRSQSVIGLPQVKPAGVLCATMICEHLRQLEAEIVAAGDPTEAVASGRLIWRRPFAANPSLERHVRYDP